MMIRAAITGERFQPAIASNLRSLCNRLAADLVTDMVTDSVKNLVTDSPGDCQAIAKRSQSDRLVSGLVPYRNVGRAF